jgi:relaxase-like protein
MINVIHNNGTSFKGLMAYLMHDKGADTSERVAWAHTHNLATDDPEIGWRIMAASAMHQAELKRGAGVKNTGRKSRDHVMHYTLSWHADEHGELSRAEMLQAALASMTYLGTSEGEKIGKKKTALRTQYADEHQAIIVCHEEGTDKQPHVHVMLNRVHPEHGVMLPDSKDYEKLSAWALEYRQAQNKEHYCPERVKNAAARAQGYMTSHRRKSRNIYELEQEQREAEPNSKRASLLEQMKRRAAELKSRSVEQKQRHSAAVHSLEDGHINAEKLERARRAEEVRTARSNIMDAHRPRMDELADRQAAETAAFEEAQKTVRGRVANSWQALKTKQWMTEIRQNSLQAMGQAFRLALSSGMQQQALDEYHAKERAQLEAQRRKEQQEAARQLRAEEKARLGERRRLYTVARNDLTLSQNMDRAKLKAEWSEYAKDRRVVMDEESREQHPTKKIDNQTEPLKSEFDAAAQATPDPSQDEESGRLDIFLDNQDQQPNQDKNHECDRDPFE